MRFAELVNARYSVRKYTKQVVEEEKLEQLLESARKAPSAVNFQPYKIYVIQSEENLKAIKACYHRTWLENAPVVIVVVGLSQLGWKRADDLKNHTDIDAAIFIDHLTLQAADLGLGTCWICNFDVEKVKETLKLIDKEDPIALIPVGYPQDNEIPVKKRKGLDELIIRM